MRCGSRPDRPDRVRRPLGLEPGVAPAGDAVDPRLGAQGDRDEEARQEEHERRRVASIRSGDEQAGAELEERSYEEQGPQHEGVDRGGRVGESHAPQDEDAQPHGRHHRDVEAEEEHRRLDLVAYRQAGRAPDGPAVVAPHLLVAPGPPVALAPVAAEGDHALLLVDGGDVVADAAPRQDESQREVGVLRDAVVVPAPRQRGDPMLARRSSRLRRRAARRCTGVRTR